MDYQSIKDLAKEEGKRVTDLLALAPQNDPFYTGAPASLVMAQWFADLWQRFGYSSGVHLRRVHYQLVSQDGPTLANGEPYENTEGCWNYLCNAGKYARILGLVPSDGFVDRRNPDPHVYVRPDDWDHEPAAEVDIPAYELPVIESNLSDISLAMPSPWVHGYSYSPADQPVHLELWIEKSTMDDVLLPLGERLGVNICTSLGFQSITSVIEMCKRIAARGKPARIFYVSDFDPAGDLMPVGVARQLEFWLQEYCPGADVALLPIALTAEQVRKYRLPRIPVKDSDKRKDRFENVYGTGAVELDALEALRPGALARIVEAAVRPWRDPGLSNALYRARSEASDVAYDAWYRMTAAERSRLQELQDEASSVVAGYDDRLRHIAAEMADDLAPLQAQINELRETLAELAARFNDQITSHLPARPEGEYSGGDVNTWLYDSARSYSEQMRMYKARRNGSDA